MYIAALLIVILSFYSLSITIFYILGNKIDWSIPANRENGGTSSYSCQLRKIIPINKPHNTNSKPPGFEKPQGFVTRKKFDQKLAGNITFRYSNRLKVFIKAYCL